MFTNFVKAIALFVSFVALFSACTDHRLSEPVPNRLRLKRTISTIPGFPGTTEFTYDNLGRELSYVYEGNRATFEYDPRNRVRNMTYLFPTTPSSASGEYSSFIYDDAAGTVTVDTYTLFIINGDKVRGDIRTTKIYTLNGQNQAVSLLEQNFSSTTGVTTYTFTYSNNNLIQNAIRPTRGIASSLTYEYDNRLNPFYGLIAPGITEARRFSRNNITKALLTQATQPNQETVTTYDYNAQGLPTKATSAGSEVRFEYESY